MTARTPTNFAVFFAAFDIIAVAVAPVAINVPNGFGMMNFSIVVDEYAPTIKFGSIFRGGYDRLPVHKPIMHTALSLSMRLA